MAMKKRDLRIKEKILLKILKSNFESSRACMHYEMLNQIRKYNKHLGDALHFVEALHLVKNIHLLKALHLVQVLQLVKALHP